MDFEPAEKSTFDRLAAHPPPLGEPGYAEVRQALALLDLCLEDLSAACGLPDEEAEVIRGGVLQAAFWPLASYLAGEPGRAAAQLVDRFLDQAVALGARLAGPARVAEPAAAYGPPAAMTRFGVEGLRRIQLLHNAAVAEILLMHSSETRVRHLLRHLMVHLGLSQDDLGRMLGVSGETVRRWQQGTSRVPAPRRAAIVGAGAALTRLLAMFQPESLPQVIRRPAELFGGESGFDWILRDRLAEVADRYETALAYQA